jgi:hypothetical protein
MTRDKVDFFFVGYPKSGSTTFYHLLKNHPEFFAPDVKELKYFNTDHNREIQQYLGKNYFQLAMSEDEYTAFFREGTGKIIGDFNPINILSEDAAKNIYNYNPDAKILVSVREPVSFLRSYHFQFLYSMFEDEPDFIKALSMEESRRKGINIPRYCPRPSYLYYSSLVEYKKHIQRYTDAFGYQNVKVILFEDIIENELRVYRDILRFLNATNLEYTPPPPDRNPSHTLRFTWLRKILLYPPIKKMLYTNIPRQLIPTGVKISQKIFKKPQEKPAISNEDIIKLKARLKPNVDELNIFLNETRLVEKDIANLWGY